MVMRQPKSCEWPTSYLLPADMRWRGSFFLLHTVFLSIWNVLFPVEGGSVFGLNIYEMPSFVIKIYFVFNEQMTQNCLKLLKDKLLCATMEHGQGK